MSSDEQTRDRRDWPPITQENFYQLRSIFPNASPDLCTWILSLCHNSIAHACDFIVTNGDIHELNRRFREGDFDQFLPVAMDEDEVSEGDVELDENHTDEESGNVSDENGVDENYDSDGDDDDDQNDDLEEESEEEEDEANDEPVDPPVVVVPTGRATRMSLNELRGWTASYHERQPEPSRYCITDIYPDLKNRNYDTHSNDEDTSNRPQHYWVQFDSEIYQLTLMELLNLTPSKLAHRSITILNHDEAIDSRKAASERIHSYGLKETKLDEQQSPNTIITEWARKRNKAVRHDSGPIQEALENYKTTETLIRKEVEDLSKKGLNLLSGYEMFDCEKKSELRNDSETALRLATQPDKELKQDEELLNNLIRLSRDALQSPHDFSDPRDYFDDILLQISEVWKGSKGLNRAKALAKFLYEETCSFMPRAMSKHGLHPFTDHPYLRSRIQPSMFMFSHEMRNLTDIKADGTNSSLNGIHGSNSSNDGLNSNDGSNSVAGQKANSSLTNNSSTEDGGTSEHSKESSSTYFYGTGVQWRKKFKRKRKRTSLISSHGTECSDPRLQLSFFQPVRLSAKEKLTQLKEKQRIEERAKKEKLRKETLRDSYEGRVTKLRRKYKLKSQTSNAKKKNEERAYLQRYQKRHPMDIAADDAKEKRPPRCRCHKECKRGASHDIFDHNGPQYKWECADKKCDFQVPVEAWNCKLNLIVDCDEEKINDVGNRNSFARRFVNDYLKRRQGQKKKERDEEFVQEMKAMSDEKEKDLERMQKDLESSRVSVGFWGAFLDIRNLDEIYRITINLLQLW
eukprot:g382.t1